MVNFFKWNISGGSFFIKMETKNKTLSAGKAGIKTFAQHLAERYGEIGTKERTDFEIKAKSFAIGELIKEERKLAKMTQEQLADKIGAKKSFISRIENGRSDIQLSTLYKLIEFGLGGKISLVIK